MGTQKKGTQQRVEQDDENGLVELKVSRSSCRAGCHRKKHKKMNTRVQHRGDCVVVVGSTAMPMNTDPTAAVHTSV